MKLKVSRVSLWRLCVLSVNKHGANPVGRRTNATGRACSGLFCNKFKWKRRSRTGSCFSKLFLDLCPSGFCTSAWPATPPATCTSPTWRTPGSSCPWRSCRVSLRLPAGDEVWGTVAGDWTQQEQPVFVQRDAYQAAD